MRPVQRCSHSASASLPAAHLMKSRRTCAQQKAVTSPAESLASFRCTGRTPGPCPGRRRRTARCAARGIDMATASPQTPIHSQARLDPPASPSAWMAGRPSPWRKRLALVRQDGRRERLEQRRERRAAPASPPAAPAASRRPGEPARHGARATLVPRAAAATGGAETSGGAAAIAASAPRSMRPWTPRSSDVSEPRHIRFPAIGATRSSAAGL